MSRTHRRVKQAAFWMILGDRLATIRQIRGLTQDNVASIIGLSRSAIANIEAGKQGIDALQAANFSMIYGVSLEKIIPKVSGE